MSLQLPQLPETWSTTRVDRVASVNARIGWKALTADEYQPNGYAFLSTPNIKTRDIDFQNVNYITEARYEESPELKLQEGDVLLAKDGNTLGIVNIVRGLPRATTVNGSIAVLRPFDINSTFLKYLIECQFIQATINLLKGGMGVPHLFQWDIKRLPVPLPPPDEQRRIADFLDAETARIDRLSELRNQQVDRVNERYHVAISELTTPGISSEHERHVEWPWLPAKIPTVRLGYCAQVQTGVTVHGSREQTPGDKEYPYLRVANVQGEKLDLSEIKSIILPGQMALRSTLQPGDVVMTEANGNPDNLGRGAVWRGEISGMVHQNHIFAIRADQRILLPEYLSALLASSHGRRYFRHTSSQVGIATTSSSKVLNFPIPKISVDKQAEVIKRYQAERARTHRALEVLHQQLTLLNERRQALITAAVTGQFDVSTASGRGVTE
ncbi:restriction endonuclease subunit S [Actinomadura sp. 21ATH]|uniref:restriction endonuclease subunit S n=1 Tax=Actinomadura sp. 21ATH TaxID=1735444 RepID=UPI0035C2307A